MSSLSEKIATKGANEALSKNIKKVENELSTLNYSFNKGDVLRVSNYLLAAGRTSDAVSRQAFTKNLAEWIHTLKGGLDEDELKNFISNFEYWVNREYEKNLLDVELLAIQNFAEKGFNYREQVSGMLRKLADKVEAGEYPILLPKQPTTEELIEYAQSPEYAQHVAQYYPDAEDK